MLLTSSLLTEARYWAHALGIASILFFFALLAACACQYRWGIFAVCFVLCALTSLALLSGHSREQADLSYCTPGLVIYRHVPIPFFDVLIRSDGSFRLVDKKTSFNQRDMETLLQGSPDVLLFGRGSGNGDAGVFVTLDTRRGSEGTTLQHLVLPIPQACIELGRLRASGSKVVLVIHNS